MWNKNRIQMGYAELTGVEELDKLSLDEQLILSIWFVKFYYDNNRFPMQYEEQEVIQELQWHDKPTFDKIIDEYEVEHGRGK